LHLDRVPAHAVVHDSVELVKYGDERGAAGMVNAVLRRYRVKGTGYRVQKSKSVRFGNWPRSGRIRCGWWNGGAAV